VVTIPLAQGKVFLSIRPAQQTTSRPSQHYEMQNYLSNYVNLTDPACFRQLTERALGLATAMALRASLLKCSLISKYLSLLTFFDNFDHLSYSKNYHKHVKMISQV
jgi:hypothetical protein